jgi:hypothetical protein
MLDSSIFFKNLLLSDGSANQAHQHHLALATHLNNLVTSESFIEVQNLMDLTSAARTPRKRSSAVADVLSLERETKQRRHSSYASR